MQKKRRYQTPKLTTAELPQEIGYVGSITALSNDLFIFEDEDERGKGLHDYEQTYFTW